MDRTEVLPDGEENMTAFLSGFLTKNSRWLLLPVGTYVLVAAFYALFFPFPALGGGLFLDMASTIAANGFAPPTVIEGYTQSGVIFTYPPLMFYVIAVLLKITPFSGVEIAWLLPIVSMGAVVVASYYLGLELLGSQEDAAVAATIIGTWPDVIRMNIAAGGMVRAPALLFTVVGSIVALRLFRTNEWSYTGVGGILFGLTTLTHPVYAVVFGSSYLLLYFLIDRSKKGILQGTTVCLLGLVVASPWLFFVNQAHGLEILLKASSTQGGLFPLFGAVKTLTFLHSPFSVLVTVYSALFFIGILFSIAKREFLIVGWVVGLTVIIGSPFVYLLGAFLAAPMITTHLPNAIADVSAPPLHRVAPLLIVVAVLGYGTLSGALYAGNYLGMSSSPDGFAASVDQDDLDSMQYLQQSTPEDATVAAIGNNAEWIPYLTNRTILFGPWGMEWYGHDRFKTEMQQYSRLSTCPTASCISTVLNETGSNPDFIFVSNTGGIWGSGKTHPVSLSETMNQSENYRLVYSNDGSWIYQVQ